MFVLRRPLWAVVTVAAALNLLLAPADAYATESLKTSDSGATSLAALENAGLDFCAHDIAAIVADRTRSVDNALLELEALAAEAAVAALYSCPNPPEIWIGTFGGETVHVTHLGDEPPGALIRASSPHSGWTDYELSVRATRDHLGPEALVILITDGGWEPGPGDGPPRYPDEAVSAIAELATSAPVFVWAVRPQTTDAGFEMLFGPLFERLHERGLGLLQWVAPLEAPAWPFARFTALPTTAPETATPVPPTPTRTPASPRMPHDEAPLQLLVPLPVAGVRSTAITIVAVGGVIGLLGLALAARGLVVQVARRGGGDVGGSRLHVRLSSAAGERVVLVDERKSLELRVVDISLSLDSVAGFVRVRFPDGSSSVLVPGIPTAIAPGVSAVQERQIDRVP